MLRGILTRAVNLHTKKHVQKIDVIAGHKKCPYQFFNKTLPFTHKCSKGYLVLKVNIYYEIFISISKKFVKVKLKKNNFS